MFENAVIGPIEEFNKKCQEKHKELQSFIEAQKPTTNSETSGFNGVDFGYDSSNTTSELQDLDLKYVKCIEPGCTFKGPLSMMEYHTKSIHDEGLYSKFNIDADSWIAARKKNMPRFGLEKPKQTFKGALVKKYPTKKIKQIVIKENLDDVQSVVPKKKLKLSPSIEDLLGLGAAYGSCDEEKDNVGVVSESSVGGDVAEVEGEDLDYWGLPTVEEMQSTGAHMKRRFNRLKFPITPAMEVSSKRSAMMNPQHSYQYKCKQKRPRIGEILTADQLMSDQNVVMQCLRYFVNKNFYDDTVTILPAPDSPKLEESDKEEEDGNAYDEEDIFSNLDNSAVKSEKVKEATEKLSQETVMHPPQNNQQNVKPKTGKQRRNQNRNQRKRDKFLAEGSQISDSTESTSTNVPIIAPVLNPQPYIYQPKAQPKQVRPFQLQTGPYIPLPGNPRIAANPNFNQNKWQNWSAPIQQNMMHPNQIPNINQGGMINPNQISFNNQQNINQIQQMYNNGFNIQHTVNQPHQIYNNGLQFVNQPPPNYTNNCYSNQLPFNQPNQIQQNNVNIQPSPNNGNNNQSNVGQATNLEQNQKHSHHKSHKKHKKEKKSGKTVNKENMIFQENSLNSTPVLAEKIEVCEEDLEEGEILD